MPGDTAPRQSGPRTKEEQQLTQYGGVQVALSRQVLAGALSIKLDDLARRLTLRVERAFGESHDCEYAYFETGDDAYTLVQWKPAPNVELYAHIADPHERDGDHTARPELRHFLALAQLGKGEVVFPPASQLGDT